MPSRYLGIFAILTLLCALASLIAGLQTPRIARSINRLGDAMVRLAGPDATVAAATPLSFTAPAADPLTFGAETIADDTDPRIGHAANIAHWRRTSMLARMLATGQAQLTFTDAQGRARKYTVPASPRTIATLAPHFWLPSFTAIVAGLSGLWVWTVRHRDWSSRQFALMSVGMALAALPLAIAGETPLATPFYRWLLAANGVGSMLFGAGLMGMLTRFPLPLLSPRWGAGGLVVCLAFAVVQAFELVARAYQFISAACMGIFAIMLALLAAQVIAARHDAVARRAAVLIATSVATTMTIIVGIVILPVVLRTEQPISTAVIFPLMLVIHLGVAVAVTRTRLVSIGAWARAATLSAGDTALLVALDVMLVLIAWFLAGPMLALAAASMSAVHIGVRNTTRQRREAHQRARDRGLLRRITQLSLAVDPAERQALWTEALRLTFAPLDISPDLEPDADRAPRTTADGCSLHVPRTAATYPLGSVCI
ncbi:MAG TPA: hypothetical protein VF643_11880 [Sphingomonas sp.]|jgi:hypothetical protein